MAQEYIVNIWFGREVGFANRVVEIITTQALDALADHHLVRVSGHLEQRRVEGAAAEVVNEDVLTFGGDSGAVPMGVFEAGGGPLV
ncbi:hypothetical protein NJB14197_10850 [Mycobacterium montefiorense]|uniref:Uncharacterized protein n=1 Tax=Mycobacterium montefiorense TaxID=154654 RepID=A0AA37PRI0_9MYCO|nr:hypothetical protein MmonteBS_08920 [Mycobacterium montefiorense]GKU36869.1 hypothetical protein NJB14191_42150 [Mycobacterium montefiorense]GKU43225.1 hypothetical protein NJB14192_52080 [Mycobacterium montefiorense]GKU48463.1 hypothetical protein NJB14194_50780 [Mycobacterium montefiorense]GKU50493.1 hypothetical protein NJB14195_17390 [Mycobacterium montefiorense]